MTMTIIRLIVGIIINKLYYVDDYICILSRLLINYLL